MHDAQYYIDQWSLMNKEMAEEGTCLRIAIPSVEDINAWLSASPNETTDSE